MRIVSYIKDGAPSYGVLDAAAPLDDFEQASVVDIPSLFPGAPAGVVEFLERFDELSARVAAVSATSGTAFADLELLPVVPSPGNIICIGVNYVDHATETGSNIPDYPVVFMKFQSSITAHGADIVLPPESSQVDYEAELGLVISRTASRVSKEAALDYVGAYFTLNDVSARDYQMRTSQWVQGKSFDTFAPTGPFMVTADEIPDPQVLDISLTIGDEVLQDATTADMIFSVRHIIWYLSTVGTLRPGDVIATGTPAGVGAGRTPPRWLRNGDDVRVLISQLPTLQNTVKGD